MMQARAKRVLLGICFCMAWSHSEAEAYTAVQENAFRDLATLEHIIDVKYAPKLWKSYLFNWSLLETTEQARYLIQAEESPSTSYCQRVFAQYLSSLNDYHAGITFLANERAYLPYSFKLSGDGRCFVVDVHTQDSLIAVGDEILEMDYRPIRQSLEDICCGRGTAADFATAVRNLTYRSASLGHIVPSGSSDLKIRRPNGVERIVTVRWRYTPENIADFSQVAPLIREPRLHAPYMARRAFPNKHGNETDICLSPSMFPYYWPEFRSRYKQAVLASDHDMGAKDGFLPHFGEVLWEEPDSVFRAYIFVMRGPDGRDRSIGVIRIPTYEWMDMDSNDYRAPWEEFARLIEIFSYSTDGLIIDQTNNPGGSVFYLYGLLSMLTDQPLVVPQHRMILTQNEVQSALEWQKLLEDVTTDEEARETLEDIVEGYPIDMSGVASLRSFTDRILGCWASGDVELSDPIPLYGLDMIRPHPTVRYTHPICVLINEENFSCADLFAAMMKDNHRALLVGTTTAGAGGFVFDVGFPNRTGIDRCFLTGSLAVRSDGSFIENLGVSPHVTIEISDEDIRSGEYNEYIARVKESMIQYMDFMETYLGIS